MYSFKLATEIRHFDCLREYLKDVPLSEHDLLLTNSIILQQSFHGDHPPCHVVLLEKYGSGEPTDVMVNAIIADYRSTHFNRVIALGGGTIIDIAKILALSNVEDVKDVLYGRVPIRREKGLVAVPTTCGTGSEVTSISILEDTALKVKKGIVHPALFPDVAILIPDLLKTLPYKFFAVSSIDALIHAVESYLAPKSNPLTEIYSVSAIKVIVNQYLRIAKHGHDAAFDRIGEVLLASTMAGVAFSNTGVGAVHALSYPLGGRYHVPHGEANYAFFTEVLRTYREYQPGGKMAELLKCLQSYMGATQDEDAIEMLERLLQAVFPRTPLRAYGVNSTDVNECAQSAFEQERLMRNNYVPLTREDVYKIYMRVL